MRHERLALLLVLGCLTGMAHAEVRVMALFANQATVMVDGQMRTLRVGQSSPEGVKLISANSDRAVLEVNGQRSTYGLGSAGGLTGGMVKPKSNAVSVWPDGGGMYFSEGNINGQSLRFLIDTGASFVSLNANDAKRLGIDYRAVGKKVPLATASAAEIGYLVKIGVVKVGPIQLREVEAVVLDGNFPHVPLLGNSFLGRIDMERSGSELRLRQRL